MEKQALFFIVIFLLLVDTLSAPLASVLVIRHCSRAPSNNYDCVGPQYSKNPNDYTSRTWPAFPVASMLCTPKGLEIITRQSANLKYSLPFPVAIISDNVTRDIETSSAILRGLGLANLNFTIDGKIFKPTVYGVCPAISTALLEADIKQQLESLAPPSDYNNLIKKIQGILGTGKEPPIEAIPNVVQNGDLQGGICVADKAAATFLLEQGAGVEAAWGQLHGNELYKLLELHFYYNQVTRAGANVARNGQSNLLSHIVSALDRSLNGNAAEPKTTLFVGHDTDLTGLGALLGLSWFNSPYSANSTTPGSMMRFDVHKLASGYLQLRLSFVTTTFENAFGHLTVGPAYLGNTKQSSMDYPTFKDMVSKVIDPKCVSV